MRLVFAGTPSSALPSLRAILDSPHEVAAVITRPDAPRGRGRRMTPSPVAELAHDSGLETLKPRSPRDPDFLTRLEQLAPECCPVVAYGGLIPSPALAVPRHGWVNLHFSLLPAWRGAAPIQRALLAGDDITGATTFRLVRELDAGPVYGCLTEKIRPDDTAGTLLERLAHHGAGLLLTTLNGIRAGELEARPQPADGVTLAPKISVNEARIDWTLPARLIDRRIRACTPQPGAWTSYGESRLKIGPVRLLEEALPLAPGELSLSKQSVAVGTASEPVELRDVQPSGKPTMAAVAWARGLRSSVSSLGS